MQGVIVVFRPDQCNQWSTRCSVVRGQFLPADWRPYAAGPLRRGKHRVSRRAECISRRRPCQSFAAADGRDTTGNLLPGHPNALDMAHGRSVYVVARCDRITGSSGRARRQSTAPKSWPRHTLSTKKSTAGRLPTSGIRSGIAQSLSTDWPRVNRRGCLACFYMAPSQRR